jgi:hypothetical protein
MLADRHTNNRRGEDCEGEEGEEVDGVSGGAVPGWVLVVGGGVGCGVGGVCSYLNGGSLLGGNVWSIWVVVVLG